MYTLLGTCLALATLLSVNTLASLVALLLARAVKSSVSRWSASARSQILFALRTLPLALSLLFVAAILIPSYLAYEPRKTEAISFNLAFLALVAACGIALAAWRGMAAWIATRRLVSDWLAHSEDASVADLEIPAFRLEHRFPVVAVTGIFRPKLFIAGQVLDGLEREELDAVLAHELGHLKERDNLKRAVVRACRDVLVMIPTGRSLACAWLEASEAAADEHTARQGSKSALNLASALVKIGRMIPTNARPAMPAGVFLVGDNQGVEGRVRKLLSLADAHEATARPVVKLKLIKLFLAALFCAFIIAAFSPQSLAAMHAVTERIVHALN